MFVSSFVQVLPLIRKKLHNSFGTFNKAAKIRVLLVFHLDSESVHIYSITGERTVVFVDYFYSSDQREDG